MIKERKASPETGQRQNGERKGGISGEVLLSTPARRRTPNSLCPRRCWMEMRILEQKLPVLVLTLVTERRGQQRGQQHPSSCIAGPGSHPSPSGRSSWFILIIACKPMGPLDSNKEMELQRFHSHQEVSGRLGLESALNWVSRGESRGKLKQVFYLQDGDFKGRRERDFSGEVARKVRAITSYGGTLLISPSPGG